jgi:hypothetical protein
MVHDYLDYNRSRADIEALEQARRLAGQAGGAAKARASPLAKPLASAIASATANAIPNAIPNAKQDAKQSAKQSAKQNASNLPPPVSRIPVNSLAAAASLLPGTRDSTGSNARGPGRAHEAENDSEDEARARLAARRRADEKNNLANWRREQQAAAAKFSEVF